MDGIQSHYTGGSLQISSEVVEKIAWHAAEEVDGVARVTAPQTQAKALLDKLTPQKPVRVEIKSDVADIEVSLVVDFGTKIPEVSERVQQNVKDSVQNMTSISVAKVDVIITGVETAPQQ